MPTRDAWAQAWQRHWSKVGLPGSEMPPGDEGDFLATARSSPWRAFVSAKGMPNGS
jgi:hypothetical protein